MTAPSRAVVAVIDRILAAEGGVADVGDGKGVTRYGQTPAWLEDHGFVPPANAGDAAANYAQWMAMTRLAELCDLDEPLGYLVTDVAVHSGLKTAVLLLQRILRVQADGVLGPVTLAAVRGADRAHLARVFLAARLRFIGDLLASTTVDRRQWARGWCNRLADQLEELP